MPPARKRLGELLVEAGVLDAMQLQAALGIQRQWGGKLGSVLVERKFISENKLVATLAQQLNVPVVQLSRTNLDPRAMSLVPAALCAQLHVFPLELKGPERTETLVVAMSDPTDLSAIDQLQFRTRKRIQAVLAGDKDINAAIRRHYYHEDVPPPPDSVPGPQRVDGVQDAPFRDAHLLGTETDEDVVPGLVAWGGTEVKPSAPAPAPAPVAASPFVPQSFPAAPAGFGAPSPFLNPAGVPPVMPLPMAVPMNPAAMAGPMRGPTGTPIAVPMVHPLVGQPSVRPAIPVMEPRGTPSSPVPLPPKPSDLDPFADLEEPPTIAVPPAPAFASAAPPRSPQAATELAPDPLEWDQPDQQPAEDNSWIDPVSAAISDDDPLAGGQATPSSDAIDLEPMEEAATIVSPAGWTPGRNDEVVDAAEEGWLKPVEEEVVGDAGFSTPSESGMPVEEDSWAAPSEDTPAEGDQAASAEWVAAETQPIATVKDPPQEAWVEQGHEVPVDASAAPAEEAVPLDVSVADVPLTLQSGWESAAEQSWTSKPPESVAADDEAVEIAPEDIEEIEEAQIEEENTSRVSTVDASAAEPAPTAEAVEAPVAADASLDWAEPVAAAEPAAEAVAVAAETPGEEPQAWAAEPAAGSWDAPPVATPTEGDPSAWAPASEEVSAPTDAAAEPGDANQWATAEEPVADSPAVEPAPTEEEGFNAASDWATSDQPAGEAPVAEAVPVEDTSAASDWAAAEEPVAEEAAPVEDLNAASDWATSDQPAAVEAVAEAAPAEDLNAASDWAASEEPIADAAPVEEAVPVEELNTASDWATSDQPVETAPVEEPAAEVEASVAAEPLSTEPEEVAVDYSSSDAWAGFSAPSEEAAPAAPEQVQPAPEVVADSADDGAALLAPDEAGVEEEAAQLRPEEAEALEQTALSDVPIVELVPPPPEAQDGVAPLEGAATEQVEAAPEAVDSSAELTAEEAPVPADEGLPVEASTAEEVPLEEAPVEAAPGEEVSLEEAPVEEASVEEASLDAPAEEPPAMEAASDDPPVEAAAEGTYEASEPVAEETAVEPVSEAPALQGWQLLGIERPTGEDAVAVVGALVNVLIARGSLSAEELVEAMRQLHETPRG